MKTGEVEVVADKVTILNAASVNLPFQIRDFHKVHSNRFVNIVAKLLGFFMIRVCKYCLNNFSGI